MDANTTFLNLTFRLDKLLYYEHTVGIGILLIVLKARGRNTSKEKLDNMKKDRVIKSKNCFICL